MPGEDSLQAELFKHGGEYKEISKKILLAQPLGSRKRGRPGMHCRGEVT